MKAIINCARNEREMYEDTRWRALPTHVPSTVFNTRVENYKGEFEWEEVSTWDLFGGRRVLLFSLPGAFTPTCSTYQLPDFERLAPEFLNEHGFDAIYCVSVNDSFVMNKWAQENKLENIEVIPDGSHKFTDGMNMLVDKDNLGFGPRSWRYACVIDNGEITDWFIEEGKEDNCEEDPYHYTSPEFILASL
mgnify:CR=1 FL=1